MAVSMRCGRLSRVIEAPKLFFFFSSRRRHTRLVSDWSQTCALPIFGNRQAERLGGREIEDKLEFGRLLDRDIGRLGPTQNLVDQVGGAPEHIRVVWSVGHERDRKSVV